MTQTLTVKLERRPDGWMSITSDDVPGLLLAGLDPAALLADLLPSVDILRSYNEKVIK